MSEGITARQTRILKALIDEYIETAEPVGSETLDKKYNFGISPATIRNEMVALTDLNYLKQPHTSSGRIPTPMAMKFYIDQLMEEKQMSLTDEVKVKEEVWDARDDLNDLMREAVHALAQRTHALAVATTDTGRMWHSGYANVFLHPEFADMQLSANLFTLLDEVKRLQDLFFGTMTGAAPVEVVFGQDVGWRDLSRIGVVGTRFSVNGRECAIGVVGPDRLQYPTVIPMVRYIRNLMQELSVGR